MNRIRGDATAASSGGSTEEARDEGETRDEERDGAWDESGADADGDDGTAAEDGDGEDTPHDRAFELIDGIEDMHDVFAPAVMEAVARLTRPEQNQWTLQVQAKIGVRNFKKVPFEQNLKLIRRRMEAQLAPDPYGRVDLIVTDRDLLDLERETVGILKAHNDPPRVYRREDALVRIRVDPETGLAVVEVIGAKQLRWEIAQVARVLDVVRRTDRGTGEVVTSHKSAEASDHLLDALLCDGDWPFPSLLGVTPVPQMRPDASILAEPGYDPATRFAYYPPRDFELPPVPDRPTRLQVEDAIALLLEAICDFPFEEPHDRANALGTLITAPLRTLFDGQVPAFLVDATGQASGKTLLVQVASCLALGEPGGTAALPATEEERRKHLTSELMTSPTFVNYDNVRGNINSPVLEQIVTTPFVKDRVLGESRIVRIPQRTIVTITANNASLGGDLNRRVVRIRLDARMVDPGSRSPDQFRHRLPDWVLEERPRLLAAVFTIARAWHQAGRPKPTRRVVFASFQSWADTIGGILEFAGVEGFLANQAALMREMDPEFEEMTAFLAAWYRRWRATPVTAKTVADGILIHGDLEAVVPAGLAQGFGHRSGVELARSVAAFLKYRKGRRYGEEGYYVSPGDKDKATNTGTWIVRRDGGPLGGGATADEASTAAAGPTTVGGDASAGSGPDPIPAHARAGVERAHEGAPELPELVGYKTSESMTKIADASPANLVVAPSADPAARSGTSGTAAPAQAWSGPAGTGIGSGPVPAGVPAGRCAQCDRPAWFAPWGADEVGIYLCEDHARAFLPLPEMPSPYDPNFTPPPGYDIRQTTIPCLSCARRGGWTHGPPLLDGWVHECIAGVIARYAPRLGCPRTTPYPISAYMSDLGQVEANFDSPTLAAVGPEGDLLEPRRCVVCVHRAARREVLGPGIYLCDDCLTATDPHDVAWANENRPRCGLCSGDGAPPVRKRGRPSAPAHHWGGMLGVCLPLPSVYERPAPGVAHSCVVGVLDTAARASANKLWELHGYPRGFERRGRAES